MSDIPHAVLSEHFQERMKNRRLVSAVFTTFEFEPAFFELEVLPVFFDVALSHASTIKWLQLEEILRKLLGRVAVYYDANGLLPEEGESARLDINRLPVRHRTGIFHPKNVFLLVEDVEPAPEGRCPRTLLAASMSANLTRAGWWKNVEVCHVEEIAGCSKTRLRNELIAYLDALKAKVPSEVDHFALNEVRSFLKKTEQRVQRSANGFLHPQFYRGSESVSDFLSEVAGNELRGMNLEVISPFFDKGSECKPLQALIDRLELNEVRRLIAQQRSAKIDMGPGFR